MEQGAPSTTSGRVRHTVTATGDNQQAPDALRLAEEALRRATQRLAMAQLGARAGVWDWDITTGQLDWSPEFYDLFGVPRDVRATFDVWRSVLYPDDRVTAEARIADSIRGRTRLFNEYRIVRPDGVTRWIEALGDTTYDASGQPVRMTGICFDITERKHTEARLRESHELLMNLARLVPGVIYQYRLDPDGRSAFPYSSPGMEDIYEVSPEDVREDATPVFGRLHPDDAAHVSEGIYESARTLTTFHCQFRVVLPRQGLRWRWCQAQPTRLTDGATLWHGIILDVTDRVQAEDDKATLEGQLRQAQKMESVGRLAGGVAHDFNNMLGVILGHTELMMAQMGARSPIHESLVEVHNAANRSADLTRQLLAFARRQPIAPKVLDLNQTVASMAAMLQRMIGEAIRLDWSTSPDVWPVKVDPSQVDQLLANLCVNARDAIPSQGRVGIRLTNVTVDPVEAASRPGAAPGDYVCIAVSDDGCGMDAETRAHLFEPFFTTKGHGKGTGLGLATVYGAVSQNNGFIDVESEIGRGTTLRVHFPRHVGSGEATGTDALPAPITRGHETLLIVEDESAVLGMARLVLERLGYKVLATNSAEEALLLAARHDDLRLLITDVVMPDVNGRELALRMTGARPGLLVLYMSGYTAEVIAQQGVLDEGLTLIQKPFSIDTLATAVREVLDRR